MQVYLNAALKDLFLGNGLSEKYQSGELRNESVGVFCASFEK